MCACGTLEGVGFCGGPGCEFPTAAAANAANAAKAATAIQPKPKGKGPDITPLVIADLQARSAEGTLKYGEPLRAENGRDALTDAYQEALDLCQYLRQEIEERRAKA